MRFGLTSFATALRWVLPFLLAYILISGLFAMHAESTLSASASPEARPHRFHLWSSILEATVVTAFVATLSIAFGSLMRRQFSRRYGLPHEARVRSVATSTILVLSVMTSIILKSALGAA